MEMTALLFLAGGFVALVLGAELLVGGAAGLAVRVGISPLVVGLTVVAFGTSAPELGVSVLAAWSGQPGIAIGNVVGSNICNTLLILGLSALAAPLVVSRKLIRVEVLLVIGASLLVWGLALDGRLGRWEGLLLFAGVVVYTVWAIRRSRRENGHGAGGLKIPAAVADSEDAPTHRLARQIALILGGLLLLGLGSKGLVTGAVSLARAFGVSDLVIGLTIVAIGTSLPELATSVLASLRGQREIAVGNIVGSNLFNLLTVLGITALVSPDGVPVAAEALRLDIPVMTAVALLCLPIFFTGHEIARWEGGLLLGYYVVYLLYLTLASTGSSLLPLVTAGLVWGILPLTGILLAVSVLRSLSKGKSKEA